MWLILFLSLSLPLSPHPFFISVTEIEYEDKEKVLGVSCKFFNDDLETALKQSSGATVDIFRGDKKRNKVYLQQYFAEHFSLSTDGRSSRLQVLGYELDGEACFVYLEAPLSTPPQTLKLNTDLLYDFNKGQINMIHYINKGNRQSHKLTYPQREVIFTSK